MQKPLLLRDSEKQNVKYNDEGDQNSSCLQDSNFGGKPIFTNMAKLPDKQLSNETAFGY